MKTWNWYVSREDEIFVDLDSKRALARAFGVLRRAIRRHESNRPGGLAVSSVWLYPSGTPNHAHLIVNTCDDMDPIQRVLWALWMGSDRIRAVYIIERLRHGVIAADVFSTYSVFEFRKPDDTCTCPKKHKSASITDSCPAMKRLMMEERSADYFPRNTDRKERESISLPWGRVPKSLILERS